MRKSAKLTVQQKAIYDLEQFAGGTVCNICGSSVFTEKYPAEKIKKAIQEHYRINDALRIRIKDDDGVLSQYVCDCETDDAEILFFNNTEELDEYAEKWAKEPVDLKGRLYEMKGVVFPDKSALVCKMHHIIGDAWTIALVGTQIYKIICKEEVQAYSYLDHAESEIEYAGTSRHEDDRKFFEECFKRCPRPLFWQDKTASSFAAERKIFNINETDKSRMLKYAKDEHASLFVLFLTAVSVCFSRIKMNADKFFIGSTMLNRSGFAEKNTCGLFINTVPVLIELDNSKTFSENLAFVKSSSWSTLRHQKYSYVELLDNLRREFDFSGKLYDVMVNYENAVLEGFSSSTWYFNGMQTETLVIQIDDRTQNGNLTVSYDYLTEIFTENDIEKIHSAILSIIDDAIENPQKKIRELRMAEEMDLSLLRGETADVPDKSLYSVFEETAAKKGNETCIVSDDKEWTFAEFAALTEFLDSKIRGITHGKKQTIAVISERCIEMYASIYAIVRGGNTYLPIDPDYPAERIGYMLEDSGTELVLAQDKFCDLVKGTRRLNVSEIIQSGELLSEKLPSAALPDDIAYIIYTSGSTGRPKGAKISQRSLLNRILWMEKQYPLDEKSVILQKTPFTFDVSLWEIFWWGLFGGKMAFMKPKEHFLPEKITDEIYNRKVTIIHFVPSVFDLFVKYLESNPAQREKISTLKHIFISGEVLSAALINRFYALFESKKIKLHNLYGPTECAVDVTFYDCKKEESDPLPIGRPIDNTDIFIMDNLMNLLPKGVIGEICIGGFNVGEGYVNNEALTNEVFLKNPFGEGRIYKTGDLGYINSENEIIFCGRKDDQIKLNGQRVELGEIENAISEIEGVTLSSVVVRQNKEETQVLCAFYSGKKKESLEIRKELEKKLPRYMIPQIITHLDEMPLTSSGKINRLSLPEIDLENIVSDKEFVEAKTDEEKVLVEAVKKVLKIDKVSMTDNFFELGGDSIQAIFVVSVLQKAGFELSVADITLHGTIAEIALLMKSTDKPDQEEETRTNILIPLTPIMKIYSNIGGMKLKEIAQTQIVSCGKSGENEIRKAVDTIVKHHDMLRAVLEKNGLKIKSFEECRPYEMKVKNLREKKEYVEFIENDCDGVDLDLENGPLVNTVVYLTDSENFLKITIHHFVIDGVSWRIIADDLSIALEQLSTGKEIRLPERTASFRAWIENLEDYKRISIANELNYWNNTLNSLDKVPDLISNCSEVHEYDEYSFTLEKTFTEQLLTSANKAFGTHADELLLSALGTALKEVYGKNDFGVCIETHGREQLLKNIDVSRTVGWFTSYFPMVLRCGETLDGTIVNIKDAIRGVPKKGIAYPLLFGRIPGKADLIYNFNGVLREGNKFTKETFRKNAARNAIPDKIAINSIVLNGELCVFVSFKGNIQANAAAALGIEYEKQLKNLISCCAEYKGSVKTLSDYSDQDLQESELEDFEKMFNEVKNE